MEKLILIIGIPILVVYEIIKIAILIKIWFEDQKRDKIMKLEVGMYVRTPKGIAKIEEITEDRTEIYFNCDTGLSISFLKKDFTQEEMAEFYKHSYNIIDLIEVGDYVNGYLIIRKTTTLLTKQLSNIEASDIKSIVTREQFESMQYKVDQKGYRV